MCKRHLHANIGNLTMDFTKQNRMFQKFKKVYQSTSNIQKGEKEVYLLDDHFKNHKKVERVNLVKQLSNTIQSIKSKETKVIYIVGLPGTGKKELAMQYAEQQYKKLKKRGNSNIFVATVDVSNPITFHQNVFKIAEKMGIIETFEQYELKSAEPEGHKRILSKLFSHLKNHSDWVLVLNGLEFNNELKWRVGVKHSRSDEMNRTIDLELKEVFLPSTGECSDGTIIITTHDSFAKRHHANNVKYLDMPNEMEYQEALQLLQIASGEEGLLPYESARKVILDLHGVPTSIYCAGLAVRSKIIHEKLTISDALYEIHKMIQGKEFSNVFTMGIEQRIGDFKYPLKMRNMQKFVLTDLSRNDKLKEKVYTLLACCASSAIPKDYITKVLEGWSIEDDFIVITKYGSEKSRVNIASRIRNLVTWISKLFEGSNTPSEKLIEYEAVQVVSGYHEILRSVIFPVKDAVELIERQGSTADCEVDLSQYKVDSLWSTDELNDMGYAKKTISTLPYDQLLDQVLLLLLTANENEDKAALCYLEPLPGHTKIYEHMQQTNFGPKTLHAIYHIGKYGACPAAVRRISQGNKPGGANIAPYLAFSCFKNLNAIIGLGVACGVEEKVNICDVLVADKVNNYDQARFGEEGIVNRGLALPTSELLSSIFGQSIKWPSDDIINRLEDSGLSKPRIKAGTILSGPYLIDNSEVKKALIQNFAAEAIGLEMEAGYLSKAVQGTPVHMTIVKAVCDFGDGKKNKHFQPTAALLAADCVKHYLDDQKVVRMLQRGPVCDFGDGEKDKHFQPTTTLSAADWVKHHLDDQEILRLLHSYPGQRTPMDFLGDFMECMVNYYIENIMKDNIVITTNKKLLLPHLSSFLHLIETRANDEFKKSFKHHIADLYWCLGNAYRLENEFKRAPLYLEKALELFKSLDDVLKQVKVYLELAKAYREDETTMNDGLLELCKAQTLLGENLNETDYEALLLLCKIHSTRGETNKMLGKYNESKDDYRKCLNLLQKMKQTEETKQLKFKTYLSLSSLERKIGDNYSCEEYIKDAETMIEDLFVADDLDGNLLLTTELKLQKALVKRDLYLVEESIKLLTEVCETYKTIYGENHAKVALVESELSLTLQRSLEESEKIALSSSQKLQEGDLYHSEKAKALCNLGTTYTHMGNFKEAEEHLDQAYEIAMDQFDIRNHTWAIRTTEILEKLGIMKRRKGETTESLNLLMQCVELKNKHYHSSNHPDMAQSLLELGKTQHKMSSLAEAFESLSRALDISATYFREHDPQTIFIKAYMARVHRDARNNDKSLKMISEAIQQYEQEIKHSDFTEYLQKQPQYVSMYVTKGILQMDTLLANPNQQHFGDDALCCLQKALDLHGLHDAPSVTQEIDIQCYLGRVHCELKNIGKADKIFRDVYKRTESSIGKNHPLTATILSNWSRVRYEEGDVNEAINNLNEAWKIRDKFLRSVTHPNPLVYAYYLAKYYNECNDMENAAHWYSISINGYAYLLSKENLRVQNLKEPHVVLQWDKLPVCDIWLQRIEECRNCYDKLF